MSRDILLINVLLTGNKQFGDVHCSAFSIMNAVHTQHVEGSFCFVTNYKTLQKCYWSESHLSCDSCQLCVIQGSHTHRSLKDLQVLLFLLHF